MFSVCRSNVSVRLKFTENKDDINKLILEVKKLLLGFRNYIVNKKN